MEVLGIWAPLGQMASQERKLRSCDVNTINPPGQMAGIRRRNKDLKLLSVGQLSVNLCLRSEALVVLFNNCILLVSSLVLFCYWFRYTCFLILAAETSRDYSEEVATANRLAFLEVRTRLRKHDAADLDRLHNYLERDFAVLVHLLEHTHSATFVPRLEDAILAIHFRTLSTCFCLTRSKLRASAAEALEGMSRVVIHLANQLGELQARC